MTGGARAQLALPPRFRTSPYGGWAPPLAYACAHTRGSASRSIRHAWKIAPFQLVQSAFRPASPSALATVPHRSIGAATSGTMAAPVLPAMGDFHEIDDDGRWPGLGAWRPSPIGSAACRGSGQAGAAERKINISKPAAKAVDRAAECGQGQRHGQHSRPSLRRPRPPRRRPTTAIISARRRSAPGSPPRTMR